MAHLLFKKCFLEAIRAGTKRTTIRRWDGCRLKAGERVFTPGVGYLTIESVEQVQLRGLNDADAAADGFSTARELCRVLHELYPDAQHNRDGRTWFRVAFRVECSDRASERTERMK